MREGWKTSKIGEVCNLRTGGTPSKKKAEYFEGGKIRWLVSGDIHKKEIVDCEGRITELGMQNSNAKFLPVNSVMIALNGQGKTRGTVAMLRTAATCNQSLVSIYPKDLDQLLPEYIFTNLHGRYQEIRRITGDAGNERRGLNMNLIRNIELPYPPLPEQKRIVAILDEAFAAIDLAMANTKKNLANARELFESYLNRVFEEKGEGWVEKRLGEVCLILMGQSPKGSSYNPAGSGVPLINGPVEFGGEEPFDRTVATKFTTEPTKMCKKGDLILCVRGSTTGRMNIAGYDSCVGRGVAAIRSHNSQNWINRFISFRSQFIYNLGSGSTFPNVSSKNLNNIIVPFPPVDQREKIIQRINYKNKELKKLQNIYVRRIEILTELKQSLLEKAFIGELIYGR